MSAEAMWPEWKMIGTPASARVFLVGERPFDLEAEVADGFGQVQCDDEFVFDDQDGGALAVFHTKFVPDAIGDPAGPG